MHLLHARLQGSQRTAAAGWEALHSLMCRGRQLTSLAVALTSTSPRQLVSRRSGLARRMTVARDSPDERALHLTTESPVPRSRRRGALIGLNDQGFDCRPSNPRSRSRVTCTERPILEPGNREVETGLTGRHLTAERSTHPGRKGTGACAASPFRGGLCRYIWEPGAGMVGGQGALIRPG
jgi:hypothetical protein